MTAAVEIYLHHGNSSFSIALLDSACTFRSCIFIKTQMPDAQKADIPAQIYVVSREFTVLQMLQQTC